MEEIRVLSPTAILGYGFPQASLDEGMRRKPHVIAVDGGSTDAGPYYLGFEPGQNESGQSGAFLESLSRDTEPLLLAALEAKIPLIIGSAGFAGGNIHLMGMLSVIQTIAAKHGLHFKMATITAEVDKAHVHQRLQENRVRPLGPVDQLQPEDIDASIRIVGQMGVEPFIDALEQGAQVIVAGRANDPSMFAALPILHGFDRGLALHMAKILECGAIAAEPGSGSDALLGTIRHDSFILEPLNPERRCTRTSVAAHSLYEKSDPYKLLGPGGYVDLSASRFEEINERSVMVNGSRFVKDPECWIKLEGASLVGYRTIAVSGIHDPVGLTQIDHFIESAHEAVNDKFSDLRGKFQLHFHVYGRNGVMPEFDASVIPQNEVGIVIEAVAESQAQATSICAHARTVILHLGFPGRVSTAGNLAFPFSPLDIPAGPVYRFNMYHLIQEDDPCALFNTNVFEV